MGGSFPPTLDPCTIMCGNLFERLRVYFGQVAVDLYTLLEEPEHVVAYSSYRLAGFHITLSVDVFQEWTYMIQAALGLTGADMHGKLTTAQVVAQWCRWVEYSATAGDKLPSCLQVFCLANQLEDAHASTEHSRC